jgi:general secretion pathway protein G
MRSGFTLVEILIVVIILGILAAIVIPQFTEASNDARLSQLKSDLQTTRSQLELYKVQHLDTYPASADGDDGTVMIAQLTQKTNVEGEYGAAADPAPTLGPYIIQFPSNPFALANNASVDVGAVQTADGDPGWYFNPDDGTFRANTADHSSL